MAFLEDWEPVLKNPTAQISQESTTGYKEAYDLGYQVRTRSVTTSSRNLRRSDADISLDTPISMLMAQIS